MATGKTFYIGTFGCQIKAHSISVTVERTTTSRLCMTSHVAAHNAPAYGTALIIFLLHIIIHYPLMTVVTFSR